MSIKHPIIKSFPYAFDGIKTAFKNEPNFRFHIAAGIIAIILGIIVGLSSLEFAVLAIAIGFVILMELINTMLEALVDLVSPEISKHAKIAKDVSAAAVLVSAILSVVIGALIFLPKIFF
jgi:diacylglycerol kinase